MLQLPKESVTEMPEQKCEIIDVKVVGTGSSGNAYLVTHGDTKILLDAGVPMAKIRKYNNNRITDIDAMLVTHSHNDHSCAMLELMGQGVRFIYSVDEQDCGKFIVSGDFQVHDADCRGYAVYFKSTNIMLHYITDTGKIVVAPERLRTDCVHYWIVECNYTGNTMSGNDENGSASAAMRNARTRETHLSDKSVIEFFKREDVPAEAVLFVHKSKHNFDYKVFRREWNGALPKLSCDVADSGDHYEFRGKRIERLLI